MKTEKKVYTFGEAAATAYQMFGLGTDSPPNLLPFGIKPLDEAIGGLVPQQGALFLAEQGIGKSSTILHGLSHSTETSAVMTTEDPPAILGARILAAKTGINSLNIILKKDLDYDRIDQAMQDLMGDAFAPSFPVIYDAIGKPLEVLVEDMQMLADMGVKLVWVDYLQKIRGHAGDNRVLEVALAFNKLQTAAARHSMGMVAASQVTGVMPGQFPHAHNVKDSKDPANEARVILCARQPYKKDGKSPENKVDYLVEKSTHGGAGLFFSMYRDASGTLVTAEEWDEQNEQEEDSDGIAW